MNTEAQTKFDNWALELEHKWEQYQVKQVTYETKAEYLMHRNCVMFDYEIHRLRKFNNPCKVCGTPLHLTKNFEIYGIGQVCGLCHTLHTIISASRYFSELHDKWRAENNKSNRYRGDKNAG